MPNHDTFISTPNHDTFISIPNHDTFISTPNHDTLISTPNFDTFISSTPEDNYQDVLIENEELKLKLFLAELEVEKLKITVKYLNQKYNN